MQNNYLVIQSESHLKSYLKSLSGIKMLGAQEEYNLAVDFLENRNKEAGHTIVVSHLPLVVKVAYSYKAYGISIADLIGEGNIALIKALSKFDPYKGYRFSTYATWWIKAYMVDFILSSWSLVRSGTLKGRKKLFFSLNKMKNNSNNVAMPEALRKLSESL